MQIKAQNTTDFNYYKTWGTYFGGKNFQAKDAALDSQGNIYLTGSILLEYSPIDISYINQFATSNAYQINYGGGISDCFLVKFDPQGNVIWTTFYGGGGDDDSLAITISAEDSVYIVGITNSTTMSSPNSFITNYNPEITNSFIAKFNSDGNRLWASYLPGTIKDIATDNLNNIYFIGYTNNHENISTPGTFQENFLTVLNSDSLEYGNGYLMKFDGLGNRIWGTYYGISNPFAIAVDRFQKPYIVGQAEEAENSTGFYATPNCHQSTKGYGFVTKFDSDGQRNWSTYYGGLNNPLTANGTIINSIALNNNNLYISGFTADTYAIASPNAFQTSINGSTDAFLVQFNTDGVRQWGTYFGGNNEEWTDLSPSISTLNNAIIITGSTSSSSNLNTTNAYQTNYSGNADSFFAKFDANGQRIWASYYGGNDYEGFNGALQVSDDLFYLWGSTKSTNNIATAGSHQPHLNDGTINETPLAENSYLAKFIPPALGETNFDNTIAIQIVPNPSNGSFIVQGNLPLSTSSINFKILDIQGREINDSSQIIISGNLSKEFDLRNLLSSGVYFLKMIGTGEETKTFKIIIQ